MKIVLGKIPLRISMDSPAVGDVYKAKGGRYETKFFAIVAIVGNMAHALGLDHDGEIVSTTSYGLHVFAQRNLVGRIAALSDLHLEIEWEDL